ncbi:hypothetical protein [Nocardia carnea]|uniref:hypothetical protein n=1 Tax=Nocardia carnea TaxID=37328 RepID=UPI0024583090|nr:hypothetical protein [Nocardia carnea]
MSDNTEDQPQSSNDFRRTRSAPTPEEARQLLGALRELRRIGALPHDMRTGPVTADYGARALEDARHAARLREVQNLSAVRAQASQQGTGRSTIRKLDVSELDTALAQSRTLARNAGVGVEDIAAAEATGATGATWMDAPSHRWLGRIEQLTDELAQVQESLHLHKKTLSSMIERAVAAESTVARQAEELAHTDNYIRSIWETLSTAEWELGQSLTVVPELAQGVTPPTDPAPDINQPDRGSGSTIGSAIDSALPEGDAAPDIWKPEPAPPPDTSPDSATDRGTGAES